MNRKGKVLTNEKWRGLGNTQTVQHMIDKMFQPHRGLYPPRENICKHAK